MTKWEPCHEISAASVVEAARQRVVSSTTAQQRGIYALILCSLACRRMKPSKRDWAGEGVKAVEAGKEVVLYLGDLFSPPALLLRCCGCHCAQLPACHININH